MYLFSGTLVLSPSTRWLCITRATSSIPRRRSGRAPPAPPRPPPPHHLWYSTRYLPPPQQQLLLLLLQPETLLTMRSDSSSSSSGSSCSGPIAVAISQASIQNPSSLIATIMTAAAVLQPTPVRIATAVLLPTPVTTATAVLWLTPVTTTTAVLLHHRWNSHQTLGINCTRAWTPRALPLTALWANGWRKSLQPRRLSQKCADQLTGCTAARSRQRHTWRIMESTRIGRRPVCFIYR